MSGVAPTAPSPLDDERRMARFDVGKLTVMLDGGEAKSKRKQELKKVVENDPYVSLYLSEAVLGLVPMVLAFGTAPKTSPCHHSPSYFMNPQSGK
jgi:hypothetical protein